MCLSLNYLYQLHRTVHSVIVERNSCDFNLNLRLSILNFPRYILRKSVSIVVTSSIVVKADVEFVCIVRDFFI